MFPELAPDSFVVGDFLERSAIELAVKGIQTVVHIGPAFHPQEAGIGTMMVDVARAAGVQHFVFSSVLHPLRTKMLNHKVKLEVEEYLIESGVPYTILEPTHMMQNLPLGTTLERGSLMIPYSPQLLQGFIDLQDFAEVTLRVIQSPREHNMARYELLGWNGSYEEVAEILGRKANKPMKAQQISIEQAVEQAVEQAETAKGGELHPYSKEAMSRMLYYYSTRGLTGNPNVLKWLLGREPSDWNSYLDRVLNKEI